MKSFLIFFIRKKVLLVDFGQQYLICKGQGHPILLSLCACLVKYLRKNVLTTALAFEHGLLVCRSGLLTFNFETVKNDLFETHFVIADFLYTFHVIHTWIRINLEKTSSDIFNYKGQKCDSLKFWAQLCLTLLLLSIKMCKKNPKINDLFPFHKMNWKKWKVFILSFLSEVNKCHIKSNNL